MSAQFEEYNNGVFKNITDYNQYGAFYYLKFWSNSNRDVHVKGNEEL